MPEVEWTKVERGRWVATLEGRRIGVATDTGWKPEPWSWGLLDPLAHWQGTAGTVRAAQRALEDAWGLAHASPTLRERVRAESLLEADTEGLFMKGRTDRMIAVRTVGESKRNGRRWVSINGVDFAPERFVEIRRIPT